ncbi:MAG: autotransporter-associated beta strand repeat-containing protein [Kiritimatiellales bacterium]
MKKKVLGIMLLVAGLCFAAQAAVKDYLGLYPSTSMLGVTTNYTGGTAPANDLTTDIIQFNQTSYTYSVQTNSGRLVNGLIFGDGTTVTAPTTISISGGAGQQLILGSSGIMMNADAGAASINKVQLGADQTWTNNSANALTITSTLGIQGSSTSPRTLTLAGTGAVNVSGIVMNGTNTSAPVLSLNVAGGTTTLSGANTYSGTTTISGGTLRIGAGGTTGTLGTGNVVNDSSLVINRSNAITVSNNISGTGSLTQFGAGTTTLTGSNSYSGGTTISGGTVAIATSNSLSTGVLTMNGGALQNSGTITNTVMNNITLDSSGGAITGTGTMNLKGTISGTGGLTKGAGASMILSLYGTNTYSGGTSNLNAGRIQLFNVNALGTGKYYVTNNSTTYFSVTDLHTGNGGLGITNDIVILGTSGGNFNALHSDTLLSGTISGSGSISANGYADGTLGLTGNNTNWTGGLLMTGSMLKLGHTNALGTGTLTLQSLNAQLGVSTDLSGGNGVANDIVLATANSTTISITNNLKLSGVISGYGGTNGLTKSGAATLTLSGANTYTGTTTVAAGQLAVDGILASDITVQNGAMLSGTGTLQAAVTVDAGGTLSVGHSPGMMTFNDALTLVSGSTNVMEIWSDVSYDVLMGAVTNTLTMAGETVFDFTGWAGGVTNGATFAFADMFSNWASTNVTGATYSTRGLGVGQSLDFTPDGFTVIPEPATIGMLGLGALITLMIRRMRTR